MEFPFIWDVRGHFSLLGSLPEAMAKQCQMLRVKKSKKVSIVDLGWLVLVVSLTRCVTN